MIVTIRGKRWRLKYCRMKDRGRCDAPDKPGKTIKIRTGQPEEKELDTLIHEMLHAASWYNDEEWVEETATDIARVLYKLGWRRAGGQ